MKIILGLSALTDPEGPVIETEYGNNMSTNVW